MEDQEPDLAVVVDVLVEDLDADDVADDVGRAVVVAPDPDQAEVVAVGVPADHLEAGEVPLGEPLEVEVVEDVAVDDQLPGPGRGPVQERLQEPGLAHVAAEVEVADDQAVVGPGPVFGGVGGREVGHRRGPGGASRSGIGRVAVSDPAIVTRTAAHHPA